MSEKKSAEEILDNQFIRRWGNTFFGMSNGYTGEQFAQESKPLVLQAMHEHAAQETESLQSELTAARTRIAELEAELVEAYKKGQYDRSRSQESFDYLSSSD